MKWPEPGRAKGVIERALGPIRAHPDLVAVSLLLAASLAIRLRHLSRPLQGDEMITFSNMVLGRDFAGIIFGPFDSNSHLLNSLIMKAVFRVAGEVPALMRLPNLIFVLVAIVVLYVVCSREFGRVVAFSSALLFSLHPAAVTFSVSGRGYAAMILFTLISSILFLQLVRSFAWWRWIGCGVAGFLAGAAHLFSANVLMAQILLVLVILVVPEKALVESLAVRTRRLGPVILAPVVALASVLALVLPQLRLAGRESFQYGFQTAFPIALTNFMGGTTYRTDLDVFSAVVLGFVLIGLFSLLISRVLKVYLGLLFLAPLSLWGLSYLAPVFTLHPRFFAFLLPVYCLLFVAGVEHAAGVIQSRMSRERPRPAAIRGAVYLAVIIVAVVFVDRVKVPRGTAFARAQQFLTELIDNDPGAHFLTNDTGFVRVRLRQEQNMDRIRSVLGIKPIRAFIDQETTGAVYYVYVPRKRFSESDLIHYQGKVPPEVHYERDDRLRTFLKTNATLEADLGPRVQIYALRSASAAEM